MKLDSNLKPYEATDKGCYTGKYKPILLYFWFVTPFFQYDLKGKGIKQ